MSDYKDAIQAIFEETIFKKYGHTEYWKLSGEEQDLLYNRATREYVERMADRADYLRKAEREGK